MTPIQKLETAVRDLYNKKDPNREEWADWLAENHVFVVADNASELAARVGANADLARAAALLHDIADVRMSRFNDNHEEESLNIGRELMRQAGFRDEDIALAVDDAVRLHSCHDGQAPESLEGKVLASADSIAHLQTDFYLHAVWAKGKQPLADVKAWALKKLERDFHDKIFFDDVREACRPDYERLKTIFSR